MDEFEEFYVMNAEKRSCKFYIEQSQIFKDATCFACCTLPMCLMLSAFFKNGSPFDGVMTQENDRIKLDKQKNYDS